MARAPKTASATAALDTGMPKLEKVNLPEVHDPIKEVPLTDEEIEERSETKSFAELLGSTIATIVPEEDLDPIVLDAYTFRALGSHSLDVGMETVHDMWVQTQKVDGWSYGDTLDLDAKTHPIITAYATLDPRFTRVDPMLNLVTLTYVAGVSVGSRAAMQPLYLAVQLVRDMVFKERDVPVDFLNSFDTQIKRVVKVVADTHELPEFFAVPLSEMLRDFVREAMTQTQETEA